MPNICLASDGEINFLWKTNAIHVDLGFYGSGSYSFYACDKYGNEILEDSVRSTTGLPSALKIMLATR